MPSRRTGSPPNQPGARSPAQREERRRRVLRDKTSSLVRSIADAIAIKAGNLFFLCQPDGHVALKRGHGFGLYYHDCRYLNGYELRLGDETPDNLAAMLIDGFQSLFQLSNPDLLLDDHTLPKQHLTLEWRRMVVDDPLALHDRLTLHNFSMSRQTFPLDLRFGCGFEDVFAVRGIDPGRRGRLEAPRWQGDTLVWRYHGADGMSRGLDIHFDPPPRERSKDGARFVVTLDPGERQVILISLRVLESASPDCEPGPPPRAPCFASIEHAKKAIEARWLADHTEINSDSILFNRILGRSLQDLHALRSTLDHDEYFAAGIPWFATLFGRDSLVTAIQTLAYNPAVAEHTLRLLAKHQGRSVDAWRDEEPGKILHELRVGEMTNLQEVPYSPYFGTVDATPLFLALIGLHAQWTGSMALFNELQEAISAAMGWVDRASEYLSYHSCSREGLGNQGWKDSGDAIVNADGSLAHPPIALVEVQGYVYLARRLLGDLYERAGDPHRATKLNHAAAELQERFIRDFWCEELGCYLLALQAGGQPVSVVSSNAGQALWSGIATPKQAMAVASRLMATDMFSGWGIRTLSTREKRYNPVGYHLGAVWPHDNSLIAAGLRRYGLDREAYRIFDGLFEAATHFDQYRVPELFTGFARSPAGEPVRYPVACHPQAWAAGSFPYMVQTVLGLSVEDMGRRLHIVRPMIPRMTQWLELKHLRVGQACVDLRYECRHGLAQVEVTGLEGPLHVVIDEPGNPGEAGR